MRRARTPLVYSDSAYIVLTSDSRELTGNALLCEDVLLASGVTDLQRYAAGSDQELAVDLFVDSVDPPEGTPGRLPGN
jgi:citronellol/citronellal dehydrogenase